MVNFKPKDIVAVVLLIGVLVLNYKGVPLMLPQALLLILGYYFAHRTNGDDLGH